MRHLIRFVAGIGLFFTLLSPGMAATDDARGREILHTWYRLVLELVRHTPNYSPPVASRAFAYVGVTVFEAVASGDDSMISLAGQLNGLTPVPKREPGKTYDDAVVIDAAMARAMVNFFSHTGPTGQRALAAATEKMAARAADGVPADVVERSRAHGQAIADHILAWSMTDGGADVQNMGFPLSYDLPKGPGKWVPTSTIAQQQLPLLPDWGKNRPFAMPEGASCPLPPPPDYSEDKNSEFYKQAMEVYQKVTSLTDEERMIARFWSDDPMLSPTPPGHWVSVVMQITERDKMPLPVTADAFARVGIAIADGFIGCWHEKYEYDYIRPVSFIKAKIDKKWEPILITPPFPEYPSGHSTQTAAAATALTGLFGENFAYDDGAHTEDGLPARHFASFWQAAEEAGISRLYGGIHFRAAIERGLDQGRCIGAYVNKLKTRK